jgi:thiamine-monophosphate kinase
MDATNSTGLTPLTEVGEFGLIEQIRKNAPSGGNHTLLGIGDDAAILDSKGLKTVVSTDCLVEGTHFDLSYVPLKHLGYKAVVVNLSDIFAMNARPAQILVSLAISSKYSLEAVDELYAGIFAACEAYGVDLVGGDTSSTPSGMVISVTAIGYAEKERITLRGGAHVNDIICVTGDLGSAYAGLQLLTREKQIFQENPGVQPELSGFEYILQRQLRPEARKELVDILRDREVKPTSMIDVSDGLASELNHICQASGCGARIFDEHIPIDPQTILLLEEMKINPTLAALNGGEDYELLFTVAPGDYEKIKDVNGISFIGHMTDLSNGVKLQTRDGLQHDLESKGWNAFGKQ